MDFKIDGVIDEAGWERAARIDTFTNFYKKSPLTEQLTEARICLDSENLYIALQCKEPLKVTVGTPGGSCWSADNTEIFLGALGPKGAAEDWYMQIVLSLNGARYTEFIAEGEYEAALRHSASDWSAEVAIPLKKLGRFDDGDKLRFNLFRQRTAASEVHTWADMVWAHDLPDFGTLKVWEDAAEVLHGPWTFGVTATGAGINWESRGKCRAKLFYREKGTAEFSVKKSASDRLHPFMLEGLKPGTEYEYHTGDGRVRSFRTLEVAPAEEFSIAFTSDIHGEAERIERILAAPQVQSADLLLLGGDLVTGCTGRGVCYNGFLDSIVAGWHKPCYYLRGNHEYRGGATGEFFRLFPLPEERAYFSFTHKGIFFLLLDTDGDVKDNEKYMKRQRKWLAGVLESREFKEAKHAILVVHQPPWPRELSGGRQLMELCRDFTAEQRAKFIVALSGHLHDYARVLPGEPGFHRPARPAVHGKAVADRMPFPALASQCKGFIIVNVKNGRITATAFDDTHREIERIPLVPAGLPLTGK